MRVASIAAVAAVLVLGPTVSADDTPAADRTRTKLLKVKISVDLKGVKLREALKEFAAQVDMQEERSVLWTYGEDIPADQPITYTCTEKPLDKVLDDVFKKLKLGYVVISADDQPRDGWVRITRGTERGFGKEPAAETTAPTPADDDESKAASRLKVAKSLIDKGMTADGKLVLMVVVNKFPKTKAAAEAKELLEKLNK